MRKYLKVLLLMILTLGVIVGCSKKEKKDEKVTLTIWIMPNSSQPKKDMEELVQPFVQKHPNIQVNVEVLDWGAAWTKISTAATSGDAPDIVQLGTTWTSQFSAMGAFLNLDDIAQEVGGDSVFVKGIWTYAKPVGSEHVTSFPWIVDVRPLFYRRDVYQKLNLKPENASTWEGFINVLKKIKEANLVIEGQKVAPIGYPGKNDWNVVHNLAPWIWGAGGDFISEDGSECLLDSKESIDGIMYYLSMVIDSLMPKDYLEKNTAQLSVEFDQGRIAHWFEPTSKYIYLNRQPPNGSANTIGGKNYGVMLPPKGSAGLKVFLGGSNLAIFKVTKHPKEAKELLKYLSTNVEAQIKYFQLSGMLPAYKKALDDPYFTQDDIRKVFRDMTNYTKAYPSVPFWGEIETSVLTPIFGQIFEYVKLTPNNKIKREEVEKLVKDAAIQIRKIIEKNKKIMETQAKAENK